MKKANLSIEADPECVESMKEALRDAKNWVKMTVEDYEDRVNEMLEEESGLIKVAGGTYSPKKILKAVDKSRWTEIVNTYFDNEARDGRFSTLDWQQDPRGNYYIMLRKGGKE